MKSALFLISLLAIVSLILAEKDENQFKNKCKRAFKKCIEKYPNIDKEEARKIFKRPGSVEGRGKKCFIACVFIKLKWIKDNKINWEKVKRDNAKIWKNKEDVEKANQITDTCSYSVQPQDDVCEMSVAKLECCHKESKKVGLEKPEMFEESSSSED